MTDWLTDREALAEQYANASNLNDRIALHERYSTNDDGLWHWVFDRFDLPNRARVLSVGCGPADLWGENAGRIPEGGTSPLRTFRRAWWGRPARTSPTVLGPLPLRSPLPSRSRSVRMRSTRQPPISCCITCPIASARSPKFAECWKPDGTLLAATSGAEHLQELRAVQEGVHGEALPRVTSFRLENGREQLDPFFESVACHRYDDTLAVTEVEPLVA